MNMLEKLEEALSKPIVYYHKFIQSYKDLCNDVFIFCEGIEDLSYYCEVIEREYPRRKINKCFAECKNNVIKIWEYIDWDNYDKKRVLFFVDRDLSYWIDEPQSYDSNVYVTDEYSFENDAVNSDMFLKCIEDIYGFANYLDTEKEQLLQFYNERWERFVEGSYELMACIIIKYESSHKHTADNIKMSNCLDVGYSGLWKSTINNLPQSEYFSVKLKVDEFDLTKKINEWKKKFDEEKDHYSIRGKWCLEFMILTCNHVIENWETFAPSLVDGNTRKPKKLVDLTHRGAMAVLGAKVKPSSTLKSFLNLNLGENDET
ncbi:DUF4435 domain-containing protein [Oribacterium sp.]